MGATDEPWNASKTKMKKIYEKFLLIPTEQYADKFLIWQIAIRNRIGFIPNIEISSLARVNIDHSIHDILNSIDQVLTPARLGRLSKYPIRAEEFMVAMSSLEKPLGKSVIVYFSVVHLVLFGN